MPWFFIFALTTRKNSQMLKKSVTYEDYNGNTVTETFYFNLTKPELIELDLGIEGGLGGFMQRLIETNDYNTLIQEFKKLILASYGIKSDDGRRFIKSDQLREEFTQTAAYAELYIQFATDDAAALEFMKGVLPKDMAEAAEKFDADEARKQLEQQPKPPAPPTTTS